ncbi:uncharacterized protein LOC118765946 [Octopus sinensis]|uniref:Uncharacterized protein LOC118765946 n=1 Tax=Octopus sinensis TaxID=2607531 RepID=A0A7E6FAH7_9MOLL|nr:uncharacterized protein LOC118765946 [Octopus sinensis]
MAMKRAVSCSFLPNTFPPQTHTLSQTTPKKHLLRAVKGNRDPPSETESTCAVRKENANQDVAFDVTPDFPPLPSTCDVVPKGEERKIITKTNTNRNTEKNEKTSNDFASAAKQISEEVKITLQDIKKAKELLRKDGNSIFLNTPQEVIEDTNKKTITYKVFDRKYKRMTNATPQQLEIALKPIWAQKSYVTKGKCFGTVEVRFPTEEQARAHAISPLQTESLLLVPTHLGRRVTKIKIDLVPPELDMSWLVAAVLYDIEDTTTILDVRRVREKNWLGMGVLLLAQIKQENISKVPDFVSLPDGTRLNVAVEGRKPKCFLCSSERHLKRDCPIQKKRMEAYSKRQQQQQKQHETPKAATPPTPSPAPRRTTPPPTTTTTTPTPVPRRSTAARREGESSPTRAPSTATGAEAPPIPAEPTTFRPAAEADPSSIPLPDEEYSDCASSDSNKGEWSTVPPKKKRRRKQKDTQGKHEKIVLPNINNDNTHSQQQTTTTLSTPLLPLPNTQTHTDALTSINTRNQELVEYLKNTTSTSITDFVIPTQNTPPAHILTIKINKTTYNEIKQIFPNDVGSLGKSFSKKLYKNIVEAPVQKHKRATPTTNNRSNGRDRSISIEKTLGKKWKQN